MAKFRSIFQGLRTVAWPFATLTPGASAPEYSGDGENADPISDRRGCIWVRSPNEPEPIPYRLSSGVWQLGRNLGGADLGQGSNNPCTIGEFTAIAGDPAIAFSANPIYFQIHQTGGVVNPGDVPILSYPVPPPPGLLSVSFVAVWQILTALNWKFSSTKDTYTAGPLGDYALFLYSVTTF